MQRALTHATRVREQSPAQFLDVQFRDTVKRPMDVVHDIYRWLKLDLPADAARPMRDWLAADETAHQSGGHVSPAQQRSEQPRVGQESVSTCRSRRLPLPSKKKLLLHYTPHP